MVRDRHGAGAVRPDEVALDHVGRSRLAEMETPLLMFPEITSRAAAVVPPTVLALAPPVTSTPLFPFGNATMPKTSVPT